MCRYVGESRWGRQAAAQKNRSEAGSYASGSGATEGKREGEVVGKVVVVGKYCAAAV